MLFKRKLLLTTCYSSELVEPYDILGGKGVAGRCLLCRGVAKKEEAQVFQTNLRGRTLLLRYAVASDEMKHGDGKLVPLVFEYTSSQYYVKEEEQLQQRG